MAKTRIKTTPTRMQKDALMASSTVTANVVQENVKKRIRQIQMPKEQLNATSTIIVPAPKRTNSICSATSSISHASDQHSAPSDTESATPPPPPLTIMADTKTNATNGATKSYNRLLCKPTTHNFAMLKNRKIYMITEKCEDSKMDAASVNAVQKRKMYLIMEDNTGQNGSTAAAEAAGVDGVGICAEDDMKNVQKYIKTENGSAAAALPKKLTLFADKCDGELTQKFEKILPEILNRIQAKDVTNNTARAAQQPNGVNDKIITKDELCDNHERLPITLPPKKNRTKIITTPYVVPITAATSTTNHKTNNCSDTLTSSGSHNAATSNGIYYQSNVKPISAATPVIVSAASLLPAKKHNGDAQTGLTLSTPQAVPQKNINLSTDFLFLMKMLPKLESIPEPHKNHVKNCIEKIVTQNASNYENN